MMDFESRKAEAKKMVVTFLEDFVEPRGLDAEALSRRITFIAEAFARRMPTTGVYRDLVMSVLERIRDTHESNTWPSQAAFVISMPADETVRRKPAETYKPDFYDSMAKKISDNGLIPETFVWSVQVDNLLRDGRMTSEQLTAYRIGSVLSWSEVYKTSALEKMVSKYGEIVRPYFKRASEEVASNGRR